MATSPLLGVRPAEGRFFAPDEESADAGEPVVVLSHGLWTRRFGASRGALNATLLLNGRTFRIVGVAPASFHTTLGLLSDLSGSRRRTNGLSALMRSGGAAASGGSSGLRGCGPARRPSRPARPSTRSRAGFSASIPTAYEVVGVARRSKYFSIGEDPRPYVYFPLRQGAARAMTVVARLSGGDPATYLREIDDTISGSTRSYRSTT